MRRSLDRESVPRPGGAFLAVAAMTVSLLPGCGSQRWVRGVVQSAPCAPQRAPQPVADATIELRCPDAPGATLSATTDAEGRLSVPLHAPLDPACEATIAQPGFAPWSAKVDALCAAFTRRGDAGLACKGVSLTAWLRPVTPVKGAP